MGLFTSFTIPYCRGAVNEVNKPMLYHRATRVSLAPLQNSGTSYCFPINRNIPCRPGNQLRENLRAFISYQDGILRFHTSYRRIPGKCLLPSVPSNPTCLFARREDATSVSAYHGFCRNSNRRNSYQLIVCS